MSNEQYGFQSASSFADILALLAESVRYKTTYISRMISLDISKAFDKVWQKEF